MATVEKKIVEMKKYCFNNHLFRKEQKEVLILRKTFLPCQGSFLKRFFILISSL